MLLNSFLCGFPKEVYVSHVFKINCFKIQFTSPGASYLDVSEARSPLHQLSQEHVCFPTSPSFKSSLHLLLLIPETFALGQVSDS